MTEILLAVEVILSFRIPYVPDPYPCGYGLEFAVVVDFASEAIEWMIGEDQLDDILTQPGDPVAIGVDIGIGHDRRMA